jgi:hypothetical protein
MIEMSERSLMPAVAVDRRATWVFADGNRLRETPL